MLTRLELIDVRLAAIVDDAVDEAGDMDELHLDDKPRAGPVLAADVQNRQLRPRHQGELLARQVLDGLDDLVARPVEQIMGWAAGPACGRLRMRPEAG
jgi:hypothetical protein